MVLSCRIHVCQSKYVSAGILLPARLAVSCVVFIGQLRIHCGTQYVSACATRKFRQSKWHVRYCNLLSRHVLPHVGLVSLCCMSAGHVQPIHQFLVIECLFVMSIRTILSPGIDVVPKLFGWDFQSTSQSVVGIVLHRLPFGSVLSSGIDVVPELFCRDIQSSGQSVVDIVLHRLPFGSVLSSGIDVVPELFCRDVQSFVASNLSFVMRDLSSRPILSTGVAVVPELFLRNVRVHPWSQPVGVQRFVCRRIFVSAGVHVPDTITLSRVSILRRFICRLWHRD